MKARALASDSIRSSSTARLLLGDDKQPTVNSKANAMARPSDDNAPSAASVIYE